MDAIGSDELGRAKIDYDKCVSCGMCLVNCPFAAIADKSQIFQVIQRHQAGATRSSPAWPPPLWASSARTPPPPSSRPPCGTLGFADVVEVAIGADLCTVEEAKDFLEKVPEKQPFMGTCCCPAWSVMAKKLFPEFKDYISMALTPMVHHRPDGEKGAPRRPDLSSSAPAPPKSWRPTASPSAPTWTSC